MAPSGRPKKYHLDLGMQLTHRPAHLGLVKEFHEIAQRYRLSYQELWACRRREGAMARREAVILLSDRGYGPTEIAWVMGMGPNAACRAIKMARAERKDFKTIDETLGVSDPYVSEEEYVARLSRLNVMKKVKRVEDGDAPVAKVVRRAREPAASLRGEDDEQQRKTSSPQPLEDAVHEPTAEDAAIVTYDEEPAPL